jgi:hypothetical protein
MSHCEGQRNLSLMAFTQQKHGFVLLQLYKWDKVCKKCGEQYGLFLMSENGIQLPVTLHQQMCGSHIIF